jgi:hypothetical protein
VASTEAVVSQCGGGAAVGQVEEVAAADPVALGSTSSSSGGAKYSKEASSVVVSDHHGPNNWSSPVLEFVEFDSPLSHPLMQQQARMSRRG